MTDKSLRMKIALRFSEADSIGVPVFLDGNSMYLPEMDAQFNISGFIDFYNEDGYSTTENIPEQYRERKFRIGDPAPIIFWLSEGAHIVEGDTEQEKLDEMFGIAAKTHPVLRDLGSMLNDARTGTIAKREERWLAAEIVAAFDDVFLEPPSRTRYWISRYRSALENARKLTQPPHPIDVRLRRASGDWLKKFATKSELPMMGTILGSKWTMR